MLGTWYLVKFFSELLYSFMISPKISKLKKKILRSISVHWDKVALRKRSPLPSQLCGIRFPEAIDHVGERRSVTRPPLPHGAGAGLAAGWGGHHAHEPLLGGLGIITP